MSVDGIVLCLVFLKKVMLNCKQGIRRSFVVLDLHTCDVAVGLMSKFVDIMTKSQEINSFNKVNVNA